MATQIEVPPLGESVTQATLLSWHKGEGETVAVDEPLCELETDKANVDVPARAAGVLHRLKNEGETVKVGEAIAEIDETAAPAVPAVAPAAPAEKIATKAKKAQSPAAAAPAPAPMPAPATAEMENLSPAVRRLVREHQLQPGEIRGSGPGGRITKEDVEGYLAQRQPKEAKAPAAQAPAPPPAKPAPMPPPASQPAPRAAPEAGFDASGLRRVPMSKIRRRIAERLVEAQHTAAILTTFNEIDMSEVIALRARHKEQFEEKHGVGLGFMSFFVRAVSLALREIPSVNASIDGDDIVYHQYVNLGIAVSTERGLAVPVLRNVQDMAFAKVEAEIKRLAAATRDGKLSLEELSGGTFTITNGGIFGSLLSTPILTPPQSGILGMHAIQKRPVAVGERVELRPMMYVALSYDHRLVDGKEAITFLLRVKQFIEEPARLLLEI